MADTMPALVDAWHDGRRQPLLAHLEQLATDGEPLAAMAAAARAALLLQGVQRIALVVILRAMAEDEVQCDAADRQARACRDLREVIR